MDHLSVKEKFKMECAIWRKFETLEARANINENIMYFPFGSTPIMNDLSKITMDYIYKKIMEI